MTDRVAELLDGKIASRQDLVLDERVETCRWLTHDGGWLAIARGPARLDFVAVIDGVYDEPKPSNPGGDMERWVVSQGVGHTASWISDDGVRAGVIVRGFDGKGTEVLDLARDLAGP